MKNHFLYAFLLAYFQLSAQADYVNLYPIGEDPSVRGMTSYNDEETILFEAAPNIRYNLFNNVYRNMLIGDKKMHTAYLLFNPHVRMYTDNSFPVKTPSYRIQLGYQKLYRLTSETNIRGQKFIAWAFETGHYSNGQSQCAFSPEFSDGSPQCDSIYQIVLAEGNLAEHLNRQSGNFSTNLTNIHFNYRNAKLDTETNIANKMLSIIFGVTIYHNRLLYLFDIGGYSDEDIDIFGQFRFHLGAEYWYVNKSGLRISAKDNVHLIANPHDEVNAFRNELTFTLYPFKKARVVGFFVDWMYGHDNYNFRFLDSNQIFSAGISWSQFPPVKMINEL